MPLENNLNINIIFIQRSENVAAAEMPNENSEAFWWREMICCIGLIR